ncbi:MAG: thiaminase II/PqqC family protein [Thermoplasmataceae archaeon]
MRCPVCLSVPSHSTFHEVGDHFIEKASDSDSDHIMWLNRNISGRKIDSEELSRRLKEFIHVEDGMISSWVRRIFINTFFLEPPHPYIALQQDPPGWLLAGYAAEHYHFLRQWVRSCASIISNTDNMEAQEYEIENISTEYSGYNGVPSHLELLLRMGESYGVKRSDIVKSKPLKETSEAISKWDTICRELPFNFAMAAMHSLELIATRGLEKYGARYPYFNHKILENGSVTKEAREFLKAGYMADASHSSVALSIVDKYTQKDDYEDLKAVVLVSINAFYQYLGARIRRGKILETKL